MEDTTSTQSAVTNDQLNAAARKALLAMLEDRSSERMLHIQLAAVETALRLTHTQSDRSNTVLH